MRGRLAQLVEQLTLNQRVVGSIPTAPTRIALASSVFSLFQKQNGHHIVINLNRVGAPVSKGIF